MVRTAHDHHRCLTSTDAPEAEQPRTAIPPPTTDNTPAYIILTPTSLTQKQNLHRPKDPDTHITKRKTSVSSYFPEKRAAIPPPLFKEVILGIFQINQSALGIAQLGQTFDATWQLSRQARCQIFPRPSYAIEYYPDVQGVSEASVVASNLIWTELRLHVIGLRC